MDNPDKYISICNNCFNNLASCSVCLSRIIIKNEDYEGFKGIRQINKSDIKDMQLVNKIVTYLY